MFSFITRESLCRCLKAPTTKRASYYEVRPSIFDSYLLVYYLLDLYNESNEINWETAHAMGVEPSRFIFWASITSAIPQSWKVLMKDVEAFENHEPSNLGRNGTASKITSKDI